jgi:hypothetical protein
LIFQLREVFLASLMTIVAAHDGQAALAAGRMLLIEANLLSPSHEPSRLRSSLAPWTSSAPEPIAASRDTSASSDPELVVEAQPGETRSHSRAIRPCNEAIGEH